MNRHVLTVFCDDVRHEVGGKLSYIGVYSGRLFVPAFPVALSKLCVAMSVVTPAEKPFTKLALRVLKDNEVLVEGTLDEAQLANVVDATSDASDDKKDRAQLLQSLFVLSPLNLERPCTLRVRVETEEGELGGLGLRIEKAPAETSVH